jgi:hypothetical protein
MSRRRSRVLVAAFSACAGSATLSAADTQLLPAPRSTQANIPARARRRTVGLGPIVQFAFGGEIYGWDIDQNGSDGLLSEAMTESSGLIFLNGIETFDESSGKITKIVQKTRTNAEVPSPVVEAIAGNDVGLIDDQFNFVKTTNSYATTNTSRCTRSRVTKSLVNGSHHTPSVTIRCSLPITRDLRAKRWWPTD